MGWEPNLLKWLREYRGVTQAALANEVGCSRVTIARLETGTRRPSVDLLPRLANALEVSVEYLLMPSRLAHEPESSRGKEEAMTLNEYLEPKDRDLTAAENHAVRVLIREGVSTAVIKEALGIKPTQVAGVRAAMTKGN